MTDLANKLEKLSSIVTTKRGSSIKHRSLISKEPLSRQNSKVLPHKKLFPIYNYQPSPYPKIFSSDEEDFDECKYVIKKPNENSEIKKIVGQKRGSKIRKSLLMQGRRNAHRKFSKGKTLGGDRRTRSENKKVNYFQNQDSVRSILKKGNSRYSKFQKMKSNSQSQRRRVGFETKKTVFCYNPKKKIKFG